MKHEHKDVNRGTILYIAKKLCTSVDDERKRPEKVVLILTYAPLRFLASRLFSFTSVSAGYWYPIENLGRFRCP